MDFSWKQEREIGEVNGKKGGVLMRKKWIIIMVVIMVVIMVCFAACGKQTEDTDTIIEDSNKEEKNGYEISSYEMEVTVSRCIQICKKEENIYILGEQGEDIVLIQCDEDGSNAKQEVLDIKKGESVYNMAVDEENRLRILTLINKKKQVKYYLKTIEENGNIMDTCELKPKRNKKDIGYVGDSLITKDGFVYMVIGDRNGNEQVICFHEDGKEVNRMDCQMIINSLVQIGDSIYAYAGTTLKELDVEKGVINENISLGDFYLTNVKICSGIDNNLYFSDRDQFCSFNTGNKIMTSLFQWIEEGINGNYIRDYIPLDNDSFFAVYIPEGEQNISAVIVRSSQSSDKNRNTKKEEKKTLSLACVNSNLVGMRENILQFNQTNEKYQIEVKDYGTNSLEPFTELNLDIVSGKIPDIICLEMLPANMYAEKGLLTDLYPFLEKDTEINAEDFVDSVRYAAEKDGKLYYMGAAFRWIDCFVIDKKYKDFVQGWSMEDMETLYQEMPKDGLFINTMTRQRFITRIVLNQIEDYIDKETGKVNFDSEEFIKLLAFSKNFQDENETDFLQEENAYKAIAEKNLMLYYTTILALDEIANLNVLYGKSREYEVINYPSKNKNDVLSICFTNPPMAISEQCEDKEGAWEFLRQFFTYDYGMKVSEYGGLLPVRKDALEKRLQYAMATEEYIDEDGTVVQPFKGGMSYGTYSVEHGALQEEDISFARSLIERIGKINMDADDIELNVIDIIKTEAESYFNGDKTAEEAAEIIQNRVQLYVNENL